MKTLTRSKIQPLTITVEAHTVHGAQAEAARLVSADPTKRLRTVTRVRPFVTGTGAGWPDHWSVEVSYTVVDPEQKAR